MSGLITILPHWHSGEWLVFYQKLWHFGVHRRSIYWFMKWSIDQTIRIHLIVSGLGHEIVHLKTRDSLSLSNPRPITRFFKENPIQTNTIYTIDTPSTVSGGTFQSSLVVNANQISVSLSGEYKCKFTMVQGQDLTYETSTNLVVRLITINPDVDIFYR